MRIVEQTHDRLVLHEEATFNHIVSIIVFFFAAFAVCIAAMFAAIPNPPMNTWLVVGIGVLLLIASVLIWLAGAPTHITFDRPADSFSIERRGRFTRFELSERLGRVKAVELEEDYSHEMHCRLYRVVVRLAGGKTVPLNASFHNNLRNRQTIIAAVESFLRGPGASAGPAGDG